MKHLLHLFSLLFICLYGNAQSITAKIIDANSGESIPFANIAISDGENLISNEEGIFTLAEKYNDATVLFVSYLGYASQQLTVADLKMKQETIKLQPGIFELDNVDVSDKKMDVNSIMAEVRKNLEKNYTIDVTPLKRTVFVRKTNSFAAKKLKLEIDKSTGFSKSALQEANASIAKLTSRLLANTALDYTDMLCNYYSGNLTINDKSVYSNKLKVVKATKLKDENRSVSLDNMENSATALLLKHLDTTKYYRIKSGWFGSRDTISLRKDFSTKKKAKQVEKKSELTSAKGNLVGIFNNNSFLYSKKMDFVNSSEIYEYTYEGALYSDKNEFVYVLSFKPKKSKAKYTGKLYISETDFAIVRADYDLVEGKTLGGINLKFLLGVKASENVSNGTLIYKKNANGIYQLQYASTETGQYFYINRPLKFIELSDSEKDVVALDIKVEGNQVEKTEFLNIDHDEISSSDFTNLKEEEFAYIKLKRYDPKIWKDYTSIEPLEAMKQFKVVEE